MVDVAFEKVDIEFSNVWRARNVLSAAFAEELEREFYQSSTEQFKPYDNRLEKKLLMDDWSKFGDSTYKFIFDLCSPVFVRRLEELTGMQNLHADYGLHGAGLFLQNPGWHLNPHVDYKTHPKIGYERKLSLLFYLTSGWDQTFSGDLCFYDDQNGKPNYESKIKIEPEFNSMVLFECTDTSWHGVDEIRCPTGVSRRAIGLFYLQETANPSGRTKAKYAPQQHQIGDVELEELIKTRQKKRIG